MGWPAINTFITFTDHSREYCELADRNDPNSSTCPHGFSVPLPDPRLIRFHAAIAHVVHLSGLAWIFFALKNSTAWEDGPFVHGRDGARFMRSVIDYTGPAITEDQELRIKLEEMDIEDSE